MTGDAVEPERLNVLIDDYIAHYKKHVAVASRPFDGVVETLDALKAEGVPMAVLTNKPQELADMVLADLGLTGYFNAIWGAGRMSYTKPDARIFHDVVRDTGALGLTAIMVGDSITDVQTARAAGAPVILVNYGYTPEPAEQLGGDAVTGDFAKIPGIVRELLG
jgi:phosphoglycolate phosphatase